MYYDWDATEISIAHSAQRAVPKSGRQKGTCIELLEY